MFGRCYYQRDEALATKSPSWGLPLTRVQYAEELLEELLNRASVIEWGAYRQAQVYPKDKNPAEYVENLEILLDAVQVFLLDCDEARIRARRARLVSGDDDDNLVDAWSNGVEGDVSLEKIGGALQTEEQADAVFVARSRTEEGAELADLAEHKVEQLISLATPLSDEVVSDPVVRICAKTLLQAIDDAHGKHEDKDDE